ncbi:MAG: hypothetical protein IH892_17870, partial [Planctomycetes bacterium]|nr:hypothetical protein [Planctomycetota bacterium]
MPSRTDRPKVSLIQSVGITLALLILGTAVLLLWTRGEAEPETAPKPLAPRIEPPLLSLELDGLSAEAQTGLLRETAAQLARRLVTDFPR